MHILDFIKTVNRYGAQKIPFFFLIDFEMQKPVLLAHGDLKSAPINFNINGYTNDTTALSRNAVKILKRPLPYDEYRNKFDRVYQHLAAGDTYLANLTIKTPVELNCTLSALYQQAQAKYKVCYKDEFIFFSPETFIQINSGKIRAFPMKGTIDATTANAGKIILTDKKEMAEHVTIVDLLRNDLSLVAKNVAVKRFRYLEEVKTTDKNLLQVSSEIEGDLAPDYNDKLGEIILALLPAGSISGAPKKKTVAILKAAEAEPRGYYTGIAGYFDGERLDSGVMIRYIEKINKQFFYRSGGGITTQSEALAEYKEAIDKVYVPAH